MESCSALAPELIVVASFRCCLCVVVDVASAMAIAW